jgi:hypothetical protein
MSFHGLFVLILREIQRHLYNILHILAAAMPLANRADEQPQDGPKTYRPLVKDFNPKDESFGFDLAKVKVEKTKDTDRTILPLPPPSFQQRRAPKPLEPPPPAKGTYETFILIRFSF